MSPAPVDPELLAQVHSRQWFYEFDLPDGTRTKSYLPDDVVPIHATRLAMLDAALDKAVGRDCSQLTAVDLACHQGWFALHLVKRGFRDVLGVDQRDNHLADTALMARIAGAQTLRLHQCDIEDAKAAEIGLHDVTLMLGLLYHLENPVRALRLARAITRKVFVIETQVVPHMSGFVDWGSWRYRRQMMGAFGIIDETEDTHANETGTRGICLAPSIETLAWLLGRVGFARVVRLPVPEGGYEQLAGHKRVMFAAHVD